MGAEVRASDQGRAVLTALIDAELDVDEAIDARTDRLDVANARLRALARKAYNGRVAGESKRREAKATFIEGAFAALLLEYAADLAGVKGLVDGHVDKQVRLVRGLDGALSDLPAVTDVELKARATDRAAGNR